MERLPSRQIAEYMALDRIEPFGDETRLLARLGAMLVSHWTGKAYTSDEFLGVPKEPPHDPTPEQINAAIDAMVNNGDDH